MQMSFEEEKKIEFEILSYVAKFCEENQLRYFLAYGTLLGAVRHKGFIPWDDDIDLYMPREDYNKFIALFNEKRDTQTYEAVAPNDKKAKHSFLKIIDTRTVKDERVFNYKNGTLGVDIDIFPLDGTPTDEQTFRKWHRKLEKIYLAILKRQLHLRGSFVSRLKEIYHKLKLGRYLFYSKKRLLAKAAKLHGLYPYEKSEYVTAMEDCWNRPRDRARRACYDEYVLLDFETGKFRAPKGYEEVLTNSYGDYMQLPPESERVTHHKNIMYWKEEDA